MGIGQHFVVPFAPAVNNGSCTMSTQKWNGAAGLGPFYAVHFATVILLAGLLPLLGIQLSCWLLLAFIRYFGPFGILLVCVARVSPMLLCGGGCSGRDLACRLQ
ncbi:unnamed protein product [Ostreobium quekettii]|uniref:Uncharacterized protein n=1 Tax=Ostreobium quekettii TaxID=121088 RepID=A0A8S1IRT1_9CHLO|nr:unnamed protein product [Ostreobium quekettii]